jgi:type IV pilus assembly protein PilV
MTQRDRRRPLRRPASGFLLIEVLVAALIFGFGVLAIVGLQAASMKDASQAKYRTDAAMLVDDLVGRMWSSAHDNASLTANFSTGGASYNDWLAYAQSVLPGIAAATVAVQPQSTTYTPPGSTTATTVITSLVTITLSWRAPNEGSSAASHQIAVTTQISS